eukprot:2739843-Rhodomonas_salina.1
MSAIQDAPHPWKAFPTKPAVASTSRRGHHLSASSPQRRQQRTATSSRHHHPHANTTKAAASDRTKTSTHRHHVHRIEEQQTDRELDGESRAVTRPAMRRGGGDGAVMRLDQRFHQR